MLFFAIVFLVLAAIAWGLGDMSWAASFAGVSKTLFYVFVALFTLTVVTQLFIVFGYQASIRRIDESNKEGTL